MAPPVLVVCAAAWLLHVGHTAILPDGLVSHSVDASPVMVADGSACPSTGLITPLGPLWHVLAQEELLCNVTLVTDTVKGHQVAFKFAQSRERQQAVRHGSAPQASGDETKTSGNHPDHVSLLLHKC